MAMFALYIASVVMAATFRLNLASKPMFRIRAPSFRMGVKAETGVNCGDDAVKWPRRPVGSDEVDFTTAQTCQECVVLDKDDPKGCDGDCEWDDDKKKCVADEDGNNLSWCEWLVIFLSILLFCVLLGIIYMLLGKKGGKDNKKDDRAQRKKEDIEKSRRESLEGQAQMERATPGPAERDFEQAPVLPPARPPSERVSVPSLYPEGEMLEAVTLANVRKGLKVVRGRSWNFTDQDGGEGCVGEIASCIRAPHWWIVKWPSAPPHAYHCGEDKEDRCDLAVAP